MLKKRLELLDEVLRLQRSLDDRVGTLGDVAHTCETSGYFYMQHVLPRWEVFLDQLDKLERVHLARVEHHDTAEDGERAADTSGSATAIDPTAFKRFFPFSKFFENAPQPLFKCIYFSFCYPNFF